jgi:3-hydroxyisobutyrate dehydrogenase-like beta-hydroxyacid dehydrogenase
MTIQSAIVPPAAVAVIGLGNMGVPARGTQVFRTGALGSGHAMKALNDYVSSAVATVEAC